MVILKIWKNKLTKLIFYQNYNLPQSAKKRVLLMVCNATIGNHRLLMIKIFVGINTAIIKKRTP